MKVQKFFNGSSIIGYDGKIYYAKNINVTLSFLCPKNLIKPLLLQLNNEKNRFIVMYGKENFDRKTRQGRFITNGSIKEDLESDKYGGVMYKINTRKGIIESPSWYESIDPFLNTNISNKILDEIIELQVTDPVTNRWAYHPKGLFSVLSDFIDSL